MEVPLNQDITYFARTHFRGMDQVFGIKRKDRRQHMYVLGKSGTGKSVMLENMIIQNIRTGEGVCVVDPHGELVEKIITAVPKERAEDVVYLNPADTDFPIGFNPMQLDDPKYKHLVASGLMGIFTKIWANAWSSRMEYILNNTILALLDTPNTTLLGIPRMLVDKDYRQYIIGNLKDPVVKAFWVHEYEAWRDQFRNEAIAPIQNKVGQFLSSNIVRNVVGQQRSTINIFDIMNQKKIFLVNVSKGRIGEDNSALLGAMLITKIQLSAMERVRIPENKREDFYLYVDEFQNFVTDSFASILSEARKYRLCLTIAHQYVAQLETETGSAVKDAVFGNVGTIIIFRVGAEDAEALEKEFEPEFIIEDFVNLPNYHIYAKLMVDGVTSRPFSAKTLPPLDVKESKDTEQYIIDTSRKLYTRTRADVEDEINRWSSTVPGQGGSSTSPDGSGSEAIGKYRAECTNCKKSIYVPFEPEPGLPIYCKECLFKIKQGELEPAAGFRPPKEKKDNISYDALAALGIEFAGGASKPRNDWNTGERPKVRPVTDRPDRPPVGVIKAGKDDLPLPRGAFKSKPIQDNTQGSAPTQTAFRVPTQANTKTETKDIPRTPPPRVVKMPISKERKAPDTAGLRSILDQALQKTMGAAKTLPAVHDATRQEVQPVVEKPKETISLSALRKDIPQAEPVFLTPKKDAAVETRDSLRAAIAQAGVTSVEEETVIPEQVQISGENEEMKEDTQNVELQAKELALEQEKKAAEEARIRAEEEKNKIEAERKALFERIEKEKKEAEERVRQAQEEERKKFEAEREALRLQAIEEERIRKEQEAALQREAHEAALLKEQQEKERLLIEKKQADEAREKAERDALEARALAEKAAQEAEARTLAKEAELAHERELLQQKAMEKPAISVEEDTSPNTTEQKQTTTSQKREVPEDILKRILE
jgi:CxxC-x17-CxxC domain-containing protein